MKNEKKNDAGTVFGPLPKLYCEKDLYCTIKIVLQESEEYCKLERLV